MLVAYAMDLVRFTNVVAMISQQETAIAMAISLTLWASVADHVLMMRTTMGYAMTTTHA